MRLALAWQVPRLALAWRFLLRSSAFLLDVMFSRLCKLFRRKPKPATQPAPRLRFTVDPRSARNLAGLDLAVQPTMRQLTQTAKAVAQGSFGVDARVISGFRSFNEQQKIYNQGRTEPGKIVTYARPGYSFHNFGIAIDFGLFDGETYLDAKEPALVARVYKSIWNNAEADGLRVEWGGNWKHLKDTPHFQYKTNLTLAEMRDRRSSGLPIIT